MQRRTTQHWAMLRVYEPPSALDCLHLVSLPYADDVPIKGGSCCSSIGVAGYSTSKCAQWRPGRCIGSPKDCMGTKGKRWSIQFFWRKLVGYSKCQVYQWQSPPYHTLPYPTLPNFPKITGEDLVPPATFEIEVQSLAASTSLLTVSSFNGSLHGHLNPGAEHCLHGAPCVGPGL